MSQKKSIGFGARGWLVIFYEFLALAMYCCINNFGQNIHANVNQQFGWNYTMVSTVYTLVSVLCVGVHEIIL